MANRRMFSKEIISSDSFTQMGLGSQALYFHLGMYADDDGVVNNFKAIQRTIGANDDDLRVLIAKRFILPIDEAGIIVIKHWRINNYIQKDRYTESKYKKDIAILGLDKNGSYSFKKEQCIQNVSKLDTQYSIDKNSIDKVSIDKSNSKVIDTTSTAHAGNEDDDLF